MKFNNVIVIDDDDDKTDNKDKEVVLMSTCCISKGHEEKGNEVAEHQNKRSQKNSSKTQHNASLISWLVYLELVT